MDTYLKTKSQIHPIVRGVIKQGDHIILCRVKDQNWYFLPGGHLENGETSKECLLRELQEEIGDHYYKITNFLGLIDNCFRLDENISQQEINMVYEVEMFETVEIESQEDGLEFIKVHKDDIKDYRILPKTLKDLIV